MLDKMTAMRFAINFIVIVVKVLLLSNLLSLSIQSSAAAATPAV